MAITESGPAAAITQSPSRALPSRDLSQSAEKETEPGINAVVLANFDLADKFGGVLPSIALGPDLLGLLPEPCSSAVGNPGATPSVRRPHGARGAPQTDPQSRARPWPSSCHIRGRSGRHFRMVPPAGSFPSGPSSRSGHVRWAALLLLMVALGAFCGPARRAAHLDPVTTLREE